MAAQTISTYDLQLHAMVFSLVGVSSAPAAEWLLLLLLLFPKPAEAGPYTSVTSALLRVFPQVPFLLSQSSRDLYSTILSCIRTYSRLLFPNLRTSCTWTKTSLAGSERVDRRVKPAHLFHQLVVPLRLDPFAVQEGPVGGAQVHDVGLNQLPRHAVRALPLH